MSKTATPKPRYTITLEASGGDPAVRLRQALKVLGRRFGLRCVRIAEVQDGQAERRTIRRSVEDLGVVCTNGGQIGQPFRWFAKQHAP